MSKVKTTDRTQNFSEPWIKPFQITQIKVSILTQTCSLDKAHFINFWSESVSKIPKTLQCNFSDRKIVYCIKGKKILTDERDYLLIPHLVLQSNNKPSILFPKPKESITVFLKITHNKGIRKSNWKVIQQNITSLWVKSEVGSRIIHDFNWLFSYIFQNVHYKYTYIYCKREKWT